MTACFGWEKAMGDDDELRWWESARARRAPATSPTRIRRRARVSRDHYDGAATGWAQGATLVYAPIAEVLVAACARRAAGRSRPRRGRGHRGLRGTAPCRRGRAGRRRRPLARHARLEPRRPTAGGRRRRDATADARRLVPRRGRVVRAQPPHRSRRGPGRARPRRASGRWRAGERLRQHLAQPEPGHRRRRRPGARLVAARIGTSSSRRRRRRSSARSGR